MKYDIVYKIIKDIFFENSQCVVSIWNVAELKFLVTVNSEYGENLGNRRKSNKYWNFEKCGNLKIIENLAKCG